jgi:hypothetical protein
VRLPALSAIVLDDTNSYVNAFYASGPGALIDLSALPVIGPWLNMQMNDGGVILLDGVTELAGSLTLDSGFTMTLPGITELVFDTPQTLSVNGEGTVLSLPNATRIVNASLNVGAGATMHLPALTQLHAEGALRSLTVTGSGEFCAPLLSSLVNMTLSANSGSQLIFSNVSEFRFEDLCVGGITIAQASGQDGQGTPSRISLPLLESLDYLLQAGCGHNFVINASSGAEVLLPAMTAINLHPSSTSGGHTLSASGVDSILDLSALPALGPRLNLEMTAGGVIALDSVTTYEGGLSVSGGSQVTLPGLSTLDFDTTKYWYVSSEGSSLSLPQVTSVRRAHFHVSYGAALHLPLVTTLTGCDVYVEYGGHFDAPALMAASANGDVRTVTVIGEAQFDAPLLASLENVRLEAHQGAELLLPALTSFGFDGACAGSILSASDAGTTLSLPVLETLHYLNDPGCGFNVEAQWGALIGLPQLDTVVVTPGSGPLGVFTSFHTGSIIDLTALPGIGPGLSMNMSQGGVILLDSVATLDGSLGVDGGSVITLPGLTSLDFDSLQELSVTGAGSVLSLPDTALIVNAGLAANDGGVFLLPVLTSLHANDGLTAIAVRGTGQLSAPLLESLVNVRLSAQSGGQLELPALTEFRFEDTCTGGAAIAVAMGSDGLGAPSRITVPLLETLEYACTPNWGAFTVEASSGGEVSMPALTAVELDPANEGVHTFRASGSMSFLDLSALPVIGPWLAVQMNGGGVVALDSVSAFEGALTVDGGITVSLPGLATLDFASQTYWSVSGENTLVSLPDTTAITHAELTASNGAALDLPLLTELIDSSVYVSYTGQVDAPLLTSMSGPTAPQTVRVTAEGVFAAPLLASLVNVALDVQWGGQLVFPLLTELRFEGHCTSAILNAHGTDGLGNPSEITLPALETLAYLEENGCAFWVDAQWGAAIGLPVLQTITVDPGNATTHTFFAWGAGTLVELPALDPLPGNIALLPQNGGAILNPNL